MADALKEAIDSGKPSLIEVEVEAADSGMFSPIKAKVATTRKLGIRWCIKLAQKGLVR